jgi:ABC-type nitrate/sulfonate/bicarbonate transport system substrate-binding protein
MVKPTIKTYADLKGKKVMIDTPKGNTRLYLERMMAPHGVKYGDFDLLFAGATAARFQALASGAIDATLVNPPFNFKAYAAGFTSLGKSAPSSLDVPFNGYAVSKAWAAKNRPAIDRFLLAYQKGVDWFYDKGNRKEAIDILVKYAKLERSECEQTYDLYQELRIFDRVGAIDGSGLDNLIRIMKEDNDLEGSTELTRFADLALVTPK